MKKYLLDTNICVFCMRGKFEMNRKIALAGINNYMMVMVTDNVDHLGRIRGIEIENWKTDDPKV